MRRQQFSFLFPTKWLCGMSVPVLGETNINFYNIYLLLLEELYTDEQPSRVYGSR